MIPSYRNSYMPLIPYYTKHHYRYRHHYDGDSININNNVIRTLYCGSGSAASLPSTTANTSTTATNSNNSVVEDNDTKLLLQSSYNFILPGQIEIIGRL